MSESTTPHLSIVGVAGSICGDAKVRAVVTALAEAAGLEFGAPVRLLDCADLDAAFRGARFRSELDDAGRAALAALEGADVLVLGVPVERGSVPGVFKHLFDLADPAALAGTSAVAVLRRPAPDERDAVLRQIDGFTAALGLDAAIDPVFVDREAVDRTGVLDPALAADLHDAARRLRLARTLKTGPVWRLPATGEPLLLSR